MHKFPTPDVIAELTFEKFDSLPKSGKPNKTEWTVLSSIIQFDSTTNESKVVALGAGTKCIGQSKLCPKGLILNDSHAEVLARRGFLRYIIHQLRSNSELFSYDENASVFRIKESVSFHFFSTQVPCGDACIIIDESLSEIPAKRIKLDTDISDFGEILTQSNVFTGAKLIGNESTDPMLQTKGSLRTKPGRGDRTLSMSCSDKLSKWNVLGLNGAFLDSLLEKPIYLKTLTFSCEFNKDSIIRALYKRWEKSSFKNSRFQPQYPEIRRANVRKFDFAHDSDKNPSPNGLVFCDVPANLSPYEVSVNGKKQGITKKAQHTRKASLRISKFLLFEEFCNFLETRPSIMAKLEIQKKDLVNKSYKDLKKMSKQYFESWNSLKKLYFGDWITKPKNLLDFTISASNKDS